MMNRREPVSGKTDSVVLMLHGLGADGADLIGLADVWGPLFPTSLFLAPDAPAPCDMSPFGYQWFSLQEMTPVAIERGVKEAAPFLNQMLDEILSETKVPASRLALVGFSQGTMMSLYVAPRRAEKLAGVLGFSGLLTGTDTLAAEKKNEPEILLVHGTQDPVVPYPALAEAVAGLKAVSIPVTSLSCEGLGHGIDETGLRAGASFLNKILPRL